jgi:hypothetical protein
MTTRTCPLDGAALASGQVLCGGCLTRWRLDLEEIPGLLRELDVAITRQTSMPAASGTIRCATTTCDHGPDATGCVQGVRLDLDARASEASAALRLSVHGWARILDGEWTVPDPEPDPGEVAPGQMADRDRVRRRNETLTKVRSTRDRMLSTPTGQVALLRLAGRVVAAADWLPGAAREIRDAVRDGWAAVDRPADMQVVGRCPECSRTLYGPEGATTVRCAGCGELRDRDAVREASLAESHTLVTAAQLAAVLGAQPGTVRSWVSRGRLTAVRCNLSGQPLYRVADGQALTVTDVEVVAGG